MSTVTSDSTAQPPDLRALRQAYSRAIAANERAKDACDALRAKGASAASIRTATGHVIMAADSEILAGRAFLAALDEEDPACVICGCTTWFACVNDVTGEHCHWVHKPGKRPLCSACAGKGVTT